MDKSLQSSIIAGIFLFILTTFWFVYEYSKTIQPQRTFSVSAEGKEIAIPNIAELKIGLISEGKNLVEVQKENTKRFNLVINFLKEQGINEKDIRTENYSITPKYRYDKVMEIVGYTVSQNLSVKVRDLNKVGVILGGAVKNGANNVSGPNFTVEDEKVYLDKARENAIKEAKEKAEKIAKAAGFRLGKIISITESLYTPPPVYFGVATEKAESIPTPKIEPGSQEIKITVTITYEIK